MSTYRNGIKAHNTGYTNVKGFLNIIPQPRELVSIKDRLNDPDKI